MKYYYRHLISSTALPNISLSNECFDGINIVGGYIRPGSNATCICYLNKIGYPPAVLKWSNSMHTDLGTVINNTATALTISKLNEIENYEHNCAYFKGKLQIFYIWFYCLLFIDKKKHV